MAAQKILIVEDEQPIREMLAFHLSRAGFETLEAPDSRTARRLLANDRPDLALIDWMLPDTSGLELTRMLKRDKDYDDLAIIMLTARVDDVDKIIGLELGADDYVTKPFSVTELVARVKAIFRRIESVERRFPGGAEFLHINDLVIDTSGREVRKAEGNLSLTAREFDLLLHFARHPGQVFTRAQLLDRVWGYGHEGYEHTVNSHINRLRAKIETDPAHPLLIVTCWGVGYKFEGTPVPSPQAAASSVSGHSNVTPMRRHL